MRNPRNRKRSTRDEDRRGGLVKAEVKRKGKKRSRPAEAYPPFLLDRRRVRQGQRATLVSKGTPASATAMWHRHNNLKLPLIARMEQPLASTMIRRTCLGWWKLLAGLGSRPSRPADPSGLGVAGDTGARCDRQPHLLVRQCQERPRGVVSILLAYPRGAAPSY
jgi:hypothetical protein